MNVYEKNLKQRLESMPLEEARKAILNKEFGNDFGSPNHEFCLSWLREKECGIRDSREKKILFWCIVSAIAASAAAIISLAALFK